MGPSPSTPPRAAVAVSLTSPRPITPQSALFARLARKLSTPLRPSVGVSPIRAQGPAPRTFVSRGLSPVPFQDLLPSDLGPLFFNTQMQTQVPAFPDLPADSPTRPQDVLSLTESDSKAERPLITARRRARSPDVVPETYMERERRIMVCLRIFSRIYLLILCFLVLYNAATTLQVEA
jgi:hypothetical protein